MALLTELSLPRAWEEPPGRAAGDAGLPVPLGHVKIGESFISLFWVLVYFTETRDSA